MGTTNVRDGNRVGLGDQLIANILKHVLDQH